MTLILTGSTTFKSTLSTTAVLSTIVYSASSDCSVCIWDISPSDALSRSPVFILDRHIDYLQTIKYCAASNVLLSGGQDGYLLSWDLTTPSTSTFSRVFQSKNNSIWSLDCDETGNVIGVAFSSKTPKVLDRRAKEDQVVDLKGHSEHVRRIKVSQDGKKCITSSSDTHVILWDIGEQRPITTFSLHSDSVFALWVNEDFSRAFTGGKDRAVFETDLRTGVSNRVIEEENSILDVCPRGEEIWVATVSSKFKAYRKGGEARVVQGLPSLTAYAVNDTKKMVGTKNTDGIVEIWDILQGKVIQRHEDADLEKTIQSCNEGKANPSWFSVSLRLGALMIEISPTDAANCEEVTPQGRVNFAATLLKKAFHYWIMEREKLDFGMPLSADTPPLFCDSESGLEDALLLVSFSSPSGLEISYRKYVSEAGSNPKLEEMPRWVQSLVYKISIPRLQNEQMTFTVEPLQEEELPKLPAPKLTAVGPVKIGKIVGHIIDQIGFRPEKYGISASIPSDQCIEIISKNYILSKDATFASVKLVLFKGEREMLFYYRLKPAVKAAAL